MQLKKLAEALQAIESTYGIETCLAEAEAVYSSVYKSAESFTLGDTLSVNDPHMTMEIRREYRDVVAESLAIAAGTYIPLTPEERREMMESNYMEDRSAIEAMYSIAEDLLDNGIRFVQLCNYKGEDAGVMLEELSSNVKTYISKYNYV
jgi:hypothetical protein